MFIFIYIKMRKKLKSYIIFFYLKFIKKNFEYWKLIKDKI